MIPSEFDYRAPESVDEAVRELHESGVEAKLLAGGHSLLPLMKMRLAVPTLLVDLRRVPGLHSVQRENGTVKIGALTTHATVAATPELGLAAKAAATIADVQVRNRGTIGGSLAHGDPASDLPAVLVALEGSVTAQGPNGPREIAAADLFQDYLETALEPDEVLTEVRLPAADGWSFGYQKFNRRSEDWAMVAIAVAVKSSGGVAEDVRIAMVNMGGRPLRAAAAEGALRGQSIDQATVAAAAALAAEGTDPPADLNASADYKRHLAQVLTKRALAEAAGL